MAKTIVVLPGDGIGPEVVAEAVKVLQCLQSEFDLPLELQWGEIGGAAYEQCGNPLPDDTLTLARSADAVLLGAVGGPQWDDLAREYRPETALLKLRAALDLFANLRPAILYAQLAEASSLKPEVVAGLDIMIVRELTGGIYFGQPRGIDRTGGGERRGINTMVYRESEIQRIARSAFEIARQRGRRVCSVDKANVLECTQLWREVVSEVATEFPDVELRHLYVDNAAMQLVRQPKQFDVIVTTNMFGDILSDAAAMLTGSIGMLPSASLDAEGRGMYEPIHGTAPDIAGQDLANPLATLLSVAMMMRFSLGQPEAAGHIEAAVAAVLDNGLRTPDIYAGVGAKVGTAEMGEAVVAALHNRAR